MRRIVAALAEILWVVLLLALTATCAFHPLYAPDFFWHLKLGEVIAADGIPRTDLFSSAQPDRPYVQFNWLWELGAAQLVQAYGLHAVRVVQACLMTASIGALYLLARRVSPRRELACLVSALGLLWFEDRFQERPASLVLLFVVALAPWLLGGYRERSLLALGLASAGLGIVWSNLHGGESLLLPLCFAALALGAALGRQQLQGRRAALGLAISGLALLCSPTFLSGMGSWLGTIGTQVQAGNEEWQPAWSMLRQGLRPSYLLIALGPTLVAVAWGLEQWVRYRKSGKEALDLGEVVLCAGLLALAHQAVRNVFLALVPLLFMLKRAAPQANLVKRTAIVACALGLLGVVAEDALLHSYGSPARLQAALHWDLGPDTFPELAADFVHEAGLEGGAINDGRWGGYLIWRLWPAVRVFADSRHHFTPDMWPIFRGSHDALQRAAALDEAHARYGTELAIFRGPTFPLGAPAHYRLLFKAGDQEVFQDLRGKNAQQNLERTRQWLEKHGQPLVDADDPQLSERARRIGAQRYLATPFAKEQSAEARRAMYSPDVKERVKAVQTLAGLLYKTGEHAPAAGLYDQALRFEPNDPVLRYQAAQNLFAGGQRERAKALLEVVVKSDLPERQLRRAQAMLNAN
ncbi:MAG TPA: tetratricopeptide repeat protein [Polyangiales bacterium]|nr:tetratricopeptide repeat protein [Polyangiales bacterium]